MANKRAESKERAGAAHKALSRREREILDILYRGGEAAVADVQDQMPDAPSYSAVRALLRILEEKGHVEHRADGARYLYRPTVERGRASRSALRHLVDTFFGGSPENAMAALLDLDEASLDSKALAEIEARISKAREEGR